MHAAAPQDVSVTSMPGEQGVAVRAKLVGLRVALCRRRRDDADEAIALFELRSNLEFGGAPGNAKGSDLKLRVFQVG